MLAFLPTFLAAMQESINKKENFTNGLLMVYG
jgi:hypothetical protein